MSIEFILSEIQKGFQYQQKAFLLEAYQFLFNRPVGNPKCSSCMQDAYTEIRIFLKNEGHMKQQLKKYTCLLPNVQINGLLSHEFTDEQVEKYIEKDPKNSAFYFQLKAKEAKEVKKADENIAKQDEKD